MSPSEKNEKRKKRDYLKMEKEGTILEEGREAKIYPVGKSKIGLKEAQEMAKKTLAKRKKSKIKKQSIIDKIASAIKDIFD